MTAYESTFEVTKAFTPQTRWKVVSLLRRDGKFCSFTGAVVQFVFEFLMFWGLFNVFYFMHCKSRRKSDVSVTVLLICLSTPDYCLPQNKMLVYRFCSRPRPQRTGFPFHRASCRVPQCRARTFSVVPRNLKRVRTNYHILQTAVIRAKKAKSAWC